MSDQRRCKVTVSLHPWCRDIPRDEAVRASEDNRPGQLPTLEEAIATITQKGNDMGTKAEIQAKAYRAEASEQPAPAPPATNGLRTERVVLEIVTHTNFQNAVDTAECFAFVVGQQLRKDRGESVRVVDEELSDRWAQRLARLTDERERAIREREEFRRSFHWSEEAGTRLVAERDASLDDAAGLRGRVAELEGEKAAAIRERDDIRRKKDHNDRFLWGMVDRLEGRIVSLESQLESVADRAAAAETALEAAPAASGAAGTEPVAWCVMSSADPPHRVGLHWDQELAERWARQKQCDYNAQLNVIPLYAAPQPAKGWLTQEERKFLEQMKDDSGVRCLGTVSADRKAREHRTFEVLRGILARSTPPEVVLHEERDWYDGSGFRVPAYDASKVQGALVAAGVTWKVVGRE